MDLSRYNITGEKEAAVAAAKNNLRLVKLRWVYMSLVAGVATATTVLSKHSFDAATIYLLVFVAGLALNGLFFLIIRLFKRRLRTQQLLTVAQLTLDMAMAGVITYIEGGVNARTTVLYVFPILAAALIFHGQIVMLIAAMSGLAYVIAVLLEQYISGRILDWALLTVPLLFYPAMFLVLGRITMYLEHLGMIESREKAYNSFLSMVAHQLKHPASAVTTIIDAMNHAKDAPSAEFQQYVTMLKAENENQIRLIDNLLEAAPHTKTDLHFEIIHLDELIDKIAERVADSSDRRADLKKLAASQAVDVPASQIRLGLALTNMFDNAFRYSKPGEAVQYSVEEKSGIVKVLIRDSGQGISEVEIAHQLERFTNEGIRGMENGHIGGLGIGLFAASQIAKAHGGQIAIHSGSGVGTTVILTLPKEQPS